MEILLLILLHGRRKISSVFTGANFKDVRLLETNLSGVDLSQVANLTPKEVTLAIIDKKTKVPDNLEIHWISDETFECKVRP